MVQFGATWCRLVQFGADWCTLVQLSDDWCNMAQFGADWCTLVQLGADWCNLVQISARWCSLVQLGAVWCNLVHFGAGTFSFLITLLRYYGKVSPFAFFLIRLLRNYARYFTLLSYWHQSYCKSMCFILITLLRQGTLLLFLISIKAIVRE